MKQLERKFSKSERIVIKARFSYWSLIYDILFAAILGGIIAVLWIFAPQIENFFTKTNTVTALTEQNLKWVLLGAGLLVLAILTIHSYSIYRHELIVTEENLVYKRGILTVKSNIVPLDEIKIVESSQNSIQQLLKVGSVFIVSDAEKPIAIKNIVRPEPFARKTIKQSGINKTKAKEQQFQICFAPTEQPSTNTNNNTI